MSDRSPRSVGGSNAGVQGAGGPSGSAMPHGGAGASLPPGIFIDPCCWGQRGPGDALVDGGGVQEVVDACRMGLGGPRAWSLAKGSRLPRLWLHCAYDATTRWRVTPLEGGEFAVEAYWVAAIPNSRLGDQLRRRVHAANRAREYAWREEDRAAWEAAEQDDPGLAPAPFVWVGEACLGGRSEGDGGIPVGLSSRAHRAGWRVLAYSR